MQMLAIFSGLFFVVTAVFGFDALLGFAGIGFTGLPALYSVALALSGVIWGLVFSAADTALRELSRMRQAFRSRDRRLVTDGTNGTERCVAHGA